MASSDSITIKKDHLYIGIIVVLVILVVASVMTGGFTGLLSPSNSSFSGGRVLGNGSSLTTAVIYYERGAETSPQLNAEGTAIIIDSLIDNDLKIGSDDAPVVLVEFSDFQCPFCRMYWRESFHDILTNYVETGKVQYVFRDYPLSFHPMSQKSAEAAECARDQEKWLEFHEMVFTEQDKFGQNTVSYSVDDLKSWAASIDGLDSNEFNACLDSGTHAQEVQKDLNDGSMVGVQGTPGFYVGKRGETAQYVNGAQPYTAFKAYFDQLGN